MHSVDEFGPWHGEVKESVLRLRLSASRSGQDTAIHARLNRQVGDRGWTATWIDAGPADGVGMLAAELGKAAEWIFARSPEEACRVIFALRRVDVDVVALD
jgi:hypothetical protein